MDQKKEKTISNTPNKILKYFKGVWKRNSFDSNASFLNLKSFWIPFAFILIVFIVLWAKVVVDEQLILGWGKLEDIYNWFKVPLWWLALLIPILGLLNANHKSEQTRAAMELSRSQNNFSNYYKHLEEFQRYCDSLTGFDGTDLNRLEKRKLHHMLYPDAKEGYLKFDNDRIQDFLEFMKFFLILICKATEGNMEDRYLRDTVRQGYAQMLQGMKQLTDAFHFGNQLTIDSNAIASRDYLFGAYHHCTFIYRIFSFESNFDSVNILSNALKIFSTSIRYCNSTGGEFILVKDPEKLAAFNEQLKSCIFDLEKFQAEKCKSDNFLSQEDCNL